MNIAPYQVFFAQTRTTRPNLELPAILLSTSNDWNDFSFRTHFHYRVFEPGSWPKPIFHGDIHLGFWNVDESPDKIVDAMVKGEKGPTPAGPHFFTLHKSLQAYRDLVENLGLQKSSQVLLALNDLVAIKRLPKQPEWFDQAIESDVYNYSFIRNAETFFAFHNASSILDGISREEIDVISKHLTLRFKLHSFSNEHHVDFSFEQSSLLPKRMAVLIGKNGVGKSQALFNIVSSLLNDDERLRTYGKRPRVNRVVAVSSPGETGTTFPAPRKSRLARINYRRILLQRPSKNTDQTGIGGILIQLVRSEETLAGQSRWRMFLDAVSSISDSSLLFVRLRNQRRDTTRQPVPLPLVTLAQSGEQDGLRRWREIDPIADICRYIGDEFYPLSSGEVTFIRFAANACLHIENGTLLMFDEPETHLHPQLISKFIALLDRLLEISGSLAIIATHSAYIVREVPRSQVHVFRTDEKSQIQIGPPRLRTLGADIGSISEFVFGDDLFGRLINNLKIRLAENPDHAGSSLALLESDLPPETYMFLRRELGLDLL